MKLFFFLMNICFGPTQKHKILRVKPWQWHHFYAAKVHVSSAI